METKIKKGYRSFLAFLLMFVLLAGQFLPLAPQRTAYAAQQNSYHDPAEHWRCML